MSFGLGRGVAEVQILKKKVKIALSLELNNLINFCVNIDVNKI